MEEERPVESLRCLGKKYSMEILSAADEATTAKDLRADLEIPPATCYRRLEELAEHGFLEHDGTIVSEDLRSADAYRRRVEEINVTFSGDRPNLTVRERSRVESTLDDAWQELTTPE